MAIIIIKYNQLMTHPHKCEKNKQFKTIQKGILQKKFHTILEWNPIHDVLSLRHLSMMKRIELKHGMTNIKSEIEWYHMKWLCITLFI